MKKVYLILSFMFLLVQPAFSQEVTLTNIDITTGEGQADVVVRPNGTGDVGVLREIVTIGSSPITADLQTLNASGSSAFETLDLGKVQVELILQAFDGNQYLAKIVIALEEKNGSVQFAQQASDQSALGNSFFSDQAVELLVQEMHQKVAYQFQEEQRRYGSDFLEALRVFIEEYVRGVMDTSTQVIDSMVERNQSLKSSEVAFTPVEKSTTTQRVAQGQTYDPATSARLVSSNSLAHHKMGNKDQKNYHREEVLNIRPEEFGGQIILMPEYLTATSFDLFEQENPLPTDKPIAHLQYFVAIVPTPYGQYQTTFIMGIDYRLSEKVSHTKIMIHGNEIDEKIFFPKWREQFLNPALHEFIDTATSDKDREIKTLFANYLEPFMFDEYYDFSPLFTKAKVIFDSEATQKKLARELKKYQQAAKAYALQL